MCRFYMIWLVSYPRSGNTFFRNILYYVYGLESQALNLEKKQTIIPTDNHGLGPIVKTHLLPHQVPIKEGDTVVYLVRDGRDSVISRAYRKKHMLNKYSSFSVNLINFISRQKNSWSKHVETWSKFSTIIIHFEDLIQEPLAQVERLQEFLDLPNGQKDKLPTLQSQKEGKAKYGGGKFVHKFFRKGQIGNWAKEMKPRYKWLFHKLHGETLLRLGYIDKIPSTSLIRKLILQLTYVEIFFASLLNNYYSVLKHLSKKLDRWTF